MVRWTLFPIFLEQGLLIDDLKEGTILRHARQPKEKSSSPTGFVWNTNMATISFHWSTNMASMTSCENAKFAKTFHLSEAKNII